MSSEGKEFILPDGKVAQGVVSVNSDGSVNGGGGNPITSDTPSSVASSTTSVTLMAANANRRSLTIYNNSTANLFVCFDATATEAACKVPLSGKVNGIGGFYEMPTGQIYTGVISGIWASANGNASIYEGA